MKKSLCFAIVGFVVAVCLPVLSAKAAPQAIAVPDAGFEDHVLNPGGYIDIADAGYTGAWESVSVDAWVDYGYWRAQGGYPEDLYARSGNNKAYGYEDYIYQILDETYVQGKTYTFSVWAGQPWVTSASGWRLYFTTEDPAVELAVANGEAGLSWGQVSLAYTATAADAGKKIGIKMWGDEDVSFDDVTLTISGDPMSPDVDAGVDMITWSGRAVQLDPNVVNNDVTPLTYLWSADDPCAVFDPSADVEAPTVTITKPALVLTSISIVNPGFENPVLADGTATSTPPAWTDGYYDVTAPTVWVVGDAEAGAYNPVAGADYNGVAPEGKNVMYATSGVGFDRGMSQVLSAKLEANTQYILSALVGNPFLFNGSTAAGNYRIELLAGGVLLKSDTGASPANDKTWKTASLTYDSGAGPAQLGQALAIRLVAVNFTSGKGVDFDSVRLTAEGPAPDPYVVTLTLTVNNEGSPPENAVTDKLKIDVYDDACQAARIGKGLGADNPGDFDGNCITDFEDLAEAAAKWLTGDALTAPIPKP